MTNLDRIRNMNAEELADQMQNFNAYKCLCCDYHYRREKEGQSIFCNACCDCRDGFKAWLESEVDSE